MDPTSAAENFEVELNYNSNVVRFYSGSVTPLTSMPAILSGNISSGEWVTNHTLPMRIKNPRIWVRNCKFRTADVILKASLPKEYVKRKIQLNDIASGLYHYEIHF
ncbi:MAG: hypothetical protein HWD58_15680 [Bacteroidota bacterium]|nr:MAG: hypothetical protein HWD58_15680 [Bacteroidota bacterium]